MVRNMVYSADTPGEYQAVEQVYISGIPTGDVSNATQTTAGLMSAEDKKKLDGVVQGANAYTLPAASTSVIGGVKQAAHVASAAGDTVTKAEFEALLDALEAAGIVAGA